MNKLRQKKKQAAKRKRQPVSISDLMYLLSNAEKSVIAVFVNHMPSKQ